MALGTNQMTITTSDKFIPDIWLDEVREYLKNKLVMADLVKKLEVEGKKGDVFHIPDVSALTVSDKAANTQVVLSSPTETEFTITINKHKHVAWLVEDLVDVQSKWDLRNTYTQGAAYEIANKIDSDLLLLVRTPGLSQIRTGGATVVDADIQKAIELLDIGNVADSPRAMVFRPTQKTSFLNLDKFYRADFRGDGKSMALAGPQNGKKFGDIYGVDLYFSNNIELSTTYRNVMFHPDAFVLAIQKSPRFQAQYKEEYLGWLFVLDVVYNMAEFRDLAGIMITTTT